VLVGAPDEAVPEEEALFVLEFVKGLEVNGTIVEAFEHTEDDVSIFTVEDNVISQHFL
jgi:hypothetical protein